jgi:hypothetical protein
MSNNIKDFHQGFFYIAFDFLSLLISIFRSTFVLFCDTILLPSDSASTHETLFRDLF